MRRWIVRAAGLLAVGCVAAAAFFFWPAPQESIVVGAGQPSGAALVARGEYLARAADCEACHTARGGQPFAGGVAFALPFGTIYSPNITSDAETGIGSWSDADFVRALRRGIRRDGQNLYPAFPYAAYALLSTEDALAIRAYLATLKPVHKAPPPNELSFPFDQRYLVRAWNLLFRPSQPFRAEASRDAAWNRGAYLVEAHGHCGECHTPRNTLMGLDDSRKFAGAEQVGWLAYNLTNDSTSGLAGWSDADLQRYLATGQAEGHGPASGPMAEVVEHSLRHLRSTDVEAMVHYLRSIPARQEGPPAVQAGSVAIAGDPLGARLFVQACAGCHLPSGEGRQSPWASLRGSHTAGDPAGTNLVQVLTRGTRIRTSQGLMFMHPFTGAYTDEELSAIANHTIGQFGFRAGRITPQQIRKQRTASPTQSDEPAL